MNYTLKSFGRTVLDYEPNKITHQNSYYIFFDDVRKLDILAGGSAYTLGYGNEEILDHMRSKLGNISRAQTLLNQTSDEVGEMAAFACETGNWKSISWAVSGTDGVECAIKISDTYWKSSKPIIVSFPRVWHGTSYLCRQLGGDIVPNSRVIHVDAPVWNTSHEHTTQEANAIDRFEILGYSKMCFYID